MLRTRVITALLMLAVLLPALLAPSPWPFAFVTLALIGAAGWEWARLNGLGAAASAVGLAIAAACLAALMLRWDLQAPTLLWWLALALWVAGGIWLLRGGVEQWPRLAVAPRVVAGVLALVIAWLAITVARTVGLNFILSILCLVWAADIAAYFGGRRFGRRKLAPGISPGKSWEGVYSGVAGVWLLAFVWWWWIDARGATDTPSLFTTFIDRLGWIGTLAALTFLAGMSVVGDLVESLVKRAAGAKDSSRLLPGHGGVLDRIDALLPVFPLALALKTL